MQVAASLFRLRQRNTYQGTISLPLPRPVANFGDHLNSVDRSACQPPESGEHINEIIESSRMKARTMVDVAIQVIKNVPLFFYQFLFCSKAKKQYCVVGKIKNYFWTSVTVLQHFYSCWTTLCTT